MKIRAKSPRFFRVGLLIDTSCQWARQIITGINSYIRQSGSWHPFLEPHGSNQSFQLPRNWKGDGVIADIEDGKLDDSLHRSGLPVVNISDHFQSRHGFPQISISRRDSCKLAVNYFWNQGFRNFAYINLAEDARDTENRDYFTANVREMGGQCSVYQVKRRARGVPDWNMDIRRLGQWLISLPKPVGVFSFGVGREVVHACQIYRIRIPEEVALLMISYDDVFCEASSIPVSGILHPLQEVGYKAAEMLDQLMRGKKVPKTTLFIPPLGVETRRSTDTTAIQDPALVAALHFIRAHADQPIQVSDVVKQASVSRRVLERRFLQHLGRTPADHIRHVHLERAQSLLRETNLSMPDVAEASGFGSPEYFASAFQKRLGISPLKYRSKVRVKSW
jgi:LacI family transcriptional regulator